MCPVFPIYTERQLEAIWNKFKSEKTSWDVELKRRKQLVKLIWSICKGEDSLQIEAWTAARAALLVHRFYTVSPNCDGPGWAVGAAAVLLACKIDGVNKSIRDVTTATFYYRIKVVKKCANQHHLLKDEREMQEQMEQVRSVEMELLCALGFDFVVDVPYMELTRLFREVGLLKSLPAEHATILGSGGSNVEAAGAGGPPADAEAPAISEYVRVNLMQTALNFIKDSSESVAGLMFTPMELALAALFMSCNLMVNRGKPGKQVTLAQTLSLPEGVTFYQRFKIAEERLNAVVNFLKNLYAQQTAASISTPSQMPGGQVADSSSGALLTQASADHTDTAAAEGSGDLGAGGAASGEAPAAAGAAAGAEGIGEGGAADGAIKPQQEEHRGDGEASAGDRGLSGAQTKQQQDGDVADADGAALVRHEAAESDKGGKTRQGEGVRSGHLKRGRCAEDEAGEREDMAALDASEPAAKRVATAQGASVEVN